MRFTLGLLGLALVSCGGATVTTNQDAGVQTCQDDQDCSRGYTCTGGYCVSPTPVDAGPDVPQVPTMMVSPTLLDFGNAYVGGEFTKTFSIANIGGATLTVTAMNLVEDITVGAFTVQSKPVPMAIDPGASETVTVVLRPNDANLPMGSIKIHSDDPNPTTGLVTVDLVSRAKGSPDLAVCSNHPAPPPDCQLSTDGNPVIDYGTVPYGSSATRLIDIKNIGNGNLPIQITEISLTNPAHFSLVLFELVEDPGNPGQPLERGLTLPFYLSAGDPAATPPVAPTVIRAHLEFTAVGVDGEVPHVQLMIKYALPESPTSVPVVGTISGCIPVATDAGVPDGGADPLTDPNNCGTCGHVCVIANGVAGCVNGQCVVASCSSGYDDCDKLPGNGCEKNLRTDVDNCGVCDAVCSSTNIPIRTCVAGVCEGVCANGYDDCDHDKLTNGCEANLAIDPNNCSACDVSCSTSHMQTRTCGGGICNGTCAANYADCDGNKLTNGCETNLLTSVTNCGACTGTVNHNCNTLPHANASSVTCDTGQCKVASCPGGYYDRDGVFANGCECQSDAMPDTCDGAFDLGSVGVGQTFVYSYNLTPSPADQDWFKVTFATNNTCNFRPKVQVASAAGDPYLRVYTNCSSAAVNCGDAGNSAAANLQSWDVNYAAACSTAEGPVDPDGNVNGNYVGSFIGTGGASLLPASLTFWVQVYSGASSSSCFPYDLTISN